MAVAGAVDGASVGGGSSSADPTRTTVAYVDEAAGKYRNSEKVAEHRFARRITDVPFSGFRFQTRNTLGQLALAFADAFNAQHVASRRHAASVKDFFSIGSPVVYIATVIMPIKRYR